MSPVVMEAQLDFLQHTDAFMNGNITRLIVLNGRPVDMWDRTGASFNKRPPSFFSFWL